MAIGSLLQTVVDSSNPVALARFWQALIGGDVDIESDDWVVLDGDDDGFYLVFQRTDGRVGSATRIRFDIEVDELERAVDEAEQLGARKVGGVVDDDDGTVQVMADPDGNEFRFLSE